MPDSNYTYGPVSQQFVGKNNVLDPASLIPDFPSVDVTLQVGRTADYTPTTLGTTKKTYVTNSPNTGLDSVRAIADWAATNKYSYSITELPNELYSISITIPYDEITNEDNIAPEAPQWEIIPTVTNRSIFEAGIFYILPNGTLSPIRYTIPTVVQAAVVEAVKNNGSLQLGNDPKYAPLAGIAEQFYMYMKGGTNTIKANLITLKRQAVYSIKDPAAYDNYPLINYINESNTINPIISHIDLVNLFKVDTATQAHLIPSYAKTKQATQYGDPFDRFAFGAYLVGRPTRVNLTPTKIQITQTFEFDEWLEGLYPRYSDISHFPLLSSTPYPAGYSGHV